MSNRYDIDKFVFKALQYGASDIHFQIDDEPQLRIDGEIRQVNLPKVTPQQIEDLKGTLLAGDDAALRQLEQLGAVDKGYSVKETEHKDLCRLRVSFAKCLEGYKVVCRIIPVEIPTIEEFHMPEIFKDICLQKYGMIIVAGVTGSGKSTTIAAMLQYINEQKQAHILTLEDPIEFVHTANKSIFTRREKNAHFDTFSNGLKTALRQDPDVILVGEMRDAETIRAAMQAAETGHLVFATLHSQTTDDVAERIISTFPQDEQSQVRDTISNVGVAFIAQTLPRKIGGGRVGAYEILQLTPAAKNLIREGKSYQIQSVIETGAKEGMITLTQSLIDLHMQKMITAEELLKHASDSKAAKKYLMSVSEF